MVKIRNAAFAILFILFISGPTFLWIGQDIAHLNLPSWITANEANYLTGSTGKTKVKENFNFEGFKSGQLQKNAEEAINNRVPSRANAILTSAALQKSLIETSGILFNWVCFPTYYGSEVLYDRTYNSLLSTTYVTPRFKSGANKGIKEFGRGLAEFASKHSDIEICVMGVEYREKNSSSPAWNLVSNNWSVEECTSLWRSQTESTDNVHIKYNHYDSYAAYLKDHYLTDDHWNGFGAINAYNSIADQLNLPNYSAELPEAKGLDNYLFYGSLCRHGRILLSDRGGLVEPVFPTEGLIVSPNIATAKVLDEENIDPDESMYESFDFYLWFYGPKESSTIQNNNAPNNEIVLIICDSFGNALRWATAPNCSKTFSEYDLAGGAKSETKLATLIEKTRATKVIFVGTILNYSSFIERNPKYFYD